MQRGEAGESGGGFDAVLAQVELGEGEGGAIGERERKSRGKYYERQQME